MKRTFSILTILLAFPFILTVCARKTYSENEKVSRTVKVKDFSAIQANRGVHVVYTNGERSSKVEINATPRLIDYIYTEVKADGTLLVELRYPKEIRNFSFDETKICVKAPDICDFSASSGGRITLANKLSVKGPVKMTVSSGSRIQGKDIACKQADLKASSGSYISATTLKCEQAYLNASSGSHINATNMACERTDLKASSGSHINATDMACEQTDLNASGGSMMTVKNVVAHTVRASSRAGSNITLAGSCDKADLSSSRFSPIKSESLTVRNRK